MFFRFGSAVVLVVLVSLAGIALEKRNLELRRSLSRQHYRMDVLREAHVRLRVRTQELGAPARLIEPIDRGLLELTPAEEPTEADRRRNPVLR